MFGRSPTAPSVVHVTALHQPGLRTIRIGDESPKSEHDFFALNWCRARADAIIVTAKILRDEPALSYELAGPAAPALTKWRNRPPPILLVLTSGRQPIDLRHPALTGAARPIVFTRQGAFPGAPIEVVRNSEPGLRSAIQWLKSRGAKTISIEAGPSTSRTLYEPPVDVDELLLSIFCGDLAESLRGPAAFELHQLNEALPVQSTPYEVEERSGTWRFTGHRRNR